MDGGRVRPPVTRLSPPPHAFPVVDRHRLADAIGDGVRGTPLTLVRAPAGAGKTVAAATWAAQPASAAALAGPPAWLTLDEADERPGAFWPDVVAALARVGVHVDGGDAADPAHVDRLAAGLLAHDAPVALVLDQAERLTDRRAGRQLDQLLRAAAPRFRLVLVTRAEPVLPLHRYLLDATVTEVRYDDLAFTLPEVGALLDLHGVRTPELARIVAERTEGWAAGVRFLALAAQQRPAGAAAEVARAALVPAGSALAAYLAAEVLEALPPDHLDFLARVSVAAELPPGLARELTGRGDSDRLLSELARGNAFVLPVPGTAGSYRTHPLLRALLGAELADESPAAAAELRRRAAYWFAGAGRLAAAVEQLVAAGDWAGAAALLVDDAALAPLLVPGAPPELSRRLEQLPDDLDAPAVAVLRAALAVRHGDPSRAARELSRCDEHLAAAGAGPALAVAVTRTMLSDAVGDADATLAAAGRLLDALGSSSTARAGRNDELRALALLAAGTARLRSGDPAGARTDLTAALAATGDDGERGGPAGGRDGDGRGGPDGGAAAAIRLRALGMLALAEAGRGALTRVADLAGAADELAASCSVAATDRPAAAHLARAWVASQRQDLTAAEHWLRRALRVPECRADGLLSSVATLLQVRLRRDHGDTEGARRLAGAAGAGPPWVRALIDAEAAGDDTATAPRPAGIEPEAARVEQLLRHAHGQLGRGAAGTGRSDVVRALALARREGLRRPFAHLSPRVRRLIRSDAAVAARADWLRPAPSPPRGRAAGPQTGPPPVGRALTDRELEVLRHLSSLLTTEEVAAAMYISVNTVRTHVRGILHKLSVTRRNEAVRRARQLGLV
ncbi:LuxR C-terminal-related transcriptional regulator [Jiangella alba]|uniref:LuxR family transcriptional regulator, maltose regulon positive regulatory protein n=1 Tax=Jiangella alba TaxID=561176 RepID=A0A1H5KPH6_9ACTN|nr:LuxR C-terminal-related transcriptional regulator [Jiangella alba]SEE66590.1 LuxR family transcriptional regulator, maltose regulon positive regulatory protein [Jiangella alba]